MLAIGERGCGQPLCRRHHPLPTSTMNANSQHDDRYILKPSISWYDGARLYLRKRLDVHLRLSHMCAIIVPCAPKQI